MNKKGYLRTLEAVIAIVLIVTFIFYFTPKSLPGVQGVPENVKNAQRYILDRISTNSTLRACITGYNNGYPTGLGINCKDELRELITKNIPIGHDYNLIICEGTKSCVLTTAPPTENDIYVNDIFIASSSLTDVNPRFLRLFIWQK